MSSTSPNTLIYPPSLTSDRRPSYVKAWMFRARNSAAAELLQQCVSSYRLARFHKLRNR
ncbi:MAG: hypothetical protein AB4040_05120 [Synechococcus sp.]